jgi:hypothetical protein
MSLSSPALGGTNPALSREAALSLQQVSDAVAQLSLGSEREAPVQLDPKKDWGRIGQMISKVACDLSKLKKCDQEHLQKIGKDVETLVISKQKDTPSQDIVKTFVACFPNLKGLRFEKPDDTTLRELQPLSSLIYLNLQDCQKVTNQGCEALRSFTKLTTLHLLDCKEVSSGLVFLTSLTHLRNLTLTKVQATQKIAQRLLTSLTHLKKLKIEALAGGADPLTFATTALQSHPALLEFNGYNRHTDKTLLELLSSLKPDITEFVATGCFQVSVRSIATLLINFPKLQSITLHNCTNLDPFALWELRSILEKQKIYVFGCRRFKELERMAPGSDLKDRLPIVFSDGCGLLDISKVDDTPRNFLAAIEKERAMPKSSEKRELRLSQAHTDETFLQSLNTLDPNSTAFVATGCIYVNTSSLFTLVKKFPKLQKVELHNCAQIDPCELFEFKSFSQQIQIFGCKRRNELSRTGTHFAQFPNYAIRLHAISGGGAILIKEGDDTSENFLKAYEKEQAMSKPKSSKHEERKERKEEKKKE